MPQLCYGYGLGGQNALGVWLFGGCAFSEIILTVEIKTAFSVGLKPYATEKVNAVCLFRLIFQRYKYRCYLIMPCGCLAAVRLAK